MPCLSSGKPAGIRTSRMSAATFFLLSLLFSAMLMMACAGQKAASDDALQPPEGKVLVIICREANYQGGGRTHLLQLDTHTLGRMTNDNYFRMELWPGNYYLNIHVPSETLFGKTNAPMSVGRALALTHRDAGKVYVYVYEDGGTLRRQDAPRQALDQITRKRVLAGSLTADDTAHVKTFFKTAYTGPEVDGRPHGRGVLTWVDGSRYEGVFNHGQPTHEGRFYFPDGNIYMGRIVDGRPMGSGALMTPRGRVIYAGAFVDEKPHGKGLRSTDAEPEYCTYEEGVDATPSLSSLAKADVDAQDRSEVMRFFTYCPWSLTLDADADFAATYHAAYQQVLDTLQSSRPLRLSRALQELEAEQRTRIDEERRWCREAFSRNHRWCICAPFDQGAAQWRDCLW